MAQKRKTIRKPERYKRAKPLVIKSGSRTTYGLPKKVVVKPSLFSEPIKRATRRVTKTITQEVRQIRKKRVLPILSKISPYTCKQKKAKARHDYFSMKANGSAGPRLRRPHKNRFTVRC